MKCGIFQVQGFLNIGNQQIILLFTAALIAVILIGVLAWQMKKRNKGDHNN